MLGILFISFKIDAVFKIIIESKSNNDLKSTEGNMRKTSSNTLALEIRLGTHIIAWLNVV